MDRHSFISVVIPTHNRPWQLGACLEALSGSTLSRDRFEVVVVDDGGTASLPEIVSEKGKELQVRLVRQDRSGPAAARNRGAALGRGDLLVFTDDDCLPEPDWLATLARHAETKPDHLLGGTTVNALPDNPYAAASQHLVSYLYDYSSRQTGTRGWSGFFTSNNLAVPTQGFREIGGFDPAFPLAAGEDRDFCDRWTTQGRPTALVPEARVRHAHGLTLRTFIRQHWNYGRGAFHFHASRRIRGADPVRPQPASFYLDLIRYPLADGFGARAALESILLVASQAVNVAGYLSERFRKR